MAKYRVWVVRRKTLLLILAAIVCVIALIVGARFVFAAKNSSETSLFPAASQSPSPTGQTPAPKKPAAAKDEASYVILATCSSGLRCIQSDYSAFLLLPPGNTLKVQVFERGKRGARLVTEGIRVLYELVDNTTSSNKNNFWQYAAKYGYNVQRDIGITGNGLKGQCTLQEDGKAFVATNIPVVPYNDGSDKLNPYQIARVTVQDKGTGKVLAEQSDVVLAVSDEMFCASCHGAVKTGEAILKSHDTLSHTRLYADYQKGIIYKCADCHRDNAIGVKGVPDVEPLSQAMHGFHADNMAQSVVTPLCNNCHPGPATQCYRGAMALAGITCSDEKCHGTMANIAQTQKEGRQAWQQEVNCANCHGEKYAVNSGALYKNSYLVKTRSDKMANILLCLSCHNNPHAEWPSKLDIDNAIPMMLQNKAAPITCPVCHGGRGKVHR